MPMRENYAHAGKLCPCGKTMPMWENYAHAGKLCPSGAGDFHDHHAGRACRIDARRRIFKSEAFGRRNPEAARGFKINVWSWLSVRDIICGDDLVKPIGHADDLQGLFDYESGASCGDAHGHFAAHAAGEISDFFDQFTSMQLAQKCLALC